MIGRGGARIAVAAAALSAVAGLAVRPARAEPVASGESPPARNLRVALLAGVDDDPLAGRIDAELRAVGLTVSREAVVPELPVETQVGRELEAGAAAVVVAARSRTTVWIGETGDGASNRIGLRQDLAVDGAAGQAVLALRTVEFLRISLGLGATPLEPIAPPPVATIATPPPPPAPPAPQSWIALDVSSGVLASTGGLGPLAVLGLSLRAQLAGRLGGEFCAYAPLTESQASASDGEIRTTVWLAGGGLLLTARDTRRLALEGGAGVLAAVVQTSGTPSGNSTGQSDRQAGVAIYGRGALRIRVTPLVALRIDVLAGTAVRRPVLGTEHYASAGGQEVATWGTFFGAGMAGAELRF